MPGIKRLLSLAMAVALLLSATLPEALAGSLKSTMTDSAASESSQSSQVALEAAKKATEGASTKKKTSEESEKEDAVDEGDKAQEAVETEREVETEESKSDSKLSLSVSAPQGLSVKDGACRIDPSSSDVLIFTWSYDGKCDQYDVSVSGGIYSGQTDSRTLTLPMALFSPGSYTIAVSAVKGDKTLAKAKLSLTILSKGDPSGQSPEGQSPEGQTPEGQPSGEGQQGRAQPTGGSSKSGGKAGEGSEAEQGFSVTPGEALVNTHTSGSREMRLYGALSLTLTGTTAMNQLILDDTPLDIRLSDGSAFTAALEDDALALVPQGNPEAWLLNGAALKTLARSGISTLRLTLGSGTFDFPTLTGLTGSNYGALCAEGHSSADYLFSVAADGCSVTVADRTYRLTEDGELV